ncbi:MAG: 6-phosphofructokinase [Bacteroidota bacterium]
MTSIRHIGLLTSGGDSPGMNACIRAVVRSAIGSGLKVSGVCRGYQGMIEGDFQDLNTRSVSNIIQRGGTILKSARSQEFMTSAGRERAFQALSKREIDALVVIGGDGTFRGAEQFRKEFGIRSVGVPGTIDNALSGTDFSLGFDTAVNTAVEAIDRIRDTAASHDRLFFVEVMGRHAGHIALHAGICSGAEAILMPETPTDIPALVNHLAVGRKNGKTSNIVVVCEGDEAGGAFSIAQQVRSMAPEYDTKVTVLGHIQRGGAPTAFDRLLGTRLGVAAVEGLCEGKTDMMVGLVNGKITYTEYTNCIQQQHGPDPELLRISGITSI